MRNPFFIVAMAILLTALVVLTLFAGDGTVAGVDANAVASIAKLSVLALVAAAALTLGRHRIHARLWHAAVWLAILLVLVAGYRIVHAPPPPPPTAVQSF